MNKSTLYGDLEGVENVMELQHYPVVKKYIAHGGTGKRGEQKSTLCYSHDILDSCISVCQILVFF